MKANGAYVLVTPARNEAAYIGTTIEAVLAQTVRPMRWVIVSDGSVDETDAIVSRYSAEHDFITLVRRAADASRNYGSKVRAIWKGIEQLTNTHYQYVGVLDADVSFAPDYYESVLAEFTKDSSLGIAGGITEDTHGHGLRLRPGTVERFVPGTVQLFRRECYESIGGFRPLRFGGEDTAAIEMARMQGWNVRGFSHLQIQHHRRMGTEGIGIVRARFRHGLEDYCVGYHPLFELAKCLRRLVEPPFVVGSVCRLIGFLFGALTRQPRELPREFVDYLRKEQIKRMFRADDSRLNS